MRPARVMAVLFALAGACTGSGDGEPRDPNQPAGKVVELAGQVSAARDGAAPRPLAVGEAVFGDDTVTTGPDGLATILLAHNNVRWSLGSDKALRVDRSMAWKAKADEGGSAFDDEDPMATASAGRHTDREAGDTAATAQLPAAADQEAAPAAPAQAAPNATAADSYARAEPKAGGAGDSAGAERKSATRGRSAAPPKKILAEKSGSGAPAERALEVGGAAAAAPTAPPPNLEQPRSAPASASGTLVLGKLNVKGALSAGQVSGRVAQLGKRCRGTVAGKVTLRFEIDAAGKVVNVRLSGSPQVVSPISACVTQAARALTFPAASGGGTTQVEREIEISSPR